MGDVSGFETGGATALCHDDLFEDRFFLGEAPRAHLVIRVPAAGADDSAGGPRVETLKRLLLALGTGAVGACGVEAGDDDPCESEQREIGRAHV